MTKKTWIIFGAICVALIGGLIFVSRQAKIDVSDVDTNAVITAQARNGNVADHTFGNMKSKVILIEYGDYQCPGCGSAFPVIKKVTEKYKDQIGFIFRNYPLTTIHPNALAAASVAEAAAQQGKFWEMHDALYSSQDSWNQLSGANRTSYFMQLATQIGLNPTKTTELLDSANVQKKIAFDQALGQKVNVQGTPTFILNGKSVGDQYYLKDKIVSKGTTGADIVWSNQEAFENLVLNPILKEKGIALPK